MTTITINEELGMDRRSFESLSDLLAYLEENGLMAVLHELGKDEVTDEMMRKAETVRKEYREDSNSFSRL